MAKLQANLTWIDRVKFEGRRNYMAILEPLENAIQDGELQPGDRLPPQRELAERLGVDLTVVTRAYSSARSRGLVEGTVGRGTFVRSPEEPSQQPLVNLAHLDPPLPHDISLGSLVAQTVQAIVKTTDFSHLVSYQSFHEMEPDCRAAARWLEPALGRISAGRVLITQGAQSGLAATLSTICKPGDAVVADPLTHAGFIWVARQFGLRTIACPVDSDGFLPEALERLCASAPRSSRAPSMWCQPITTQPPSLCRLRGERRLRKLQHLMVSGLWKSTR